jgi:hypothetical protein
MHRNARLLRFREKRVLGLVLEDSSCKVQQQWQGCADASLGQGGTRQPDAPMDLLPPRKRAKLEDLRQLRRDTTYRHRFKCSCPRWRAQQPQLCGSVVVEKDLISFASFSNPYQKT